jgi:hypothetical protein
VCYVRVVAGQGNGSGGGVLEALNVRSGFVGLRAWSMCRGAHLFQGREGMIRGLLEAGAIKEATDGVSCAADLSGVISRFGRYHKPEHSW